MSYRRLLNSKGWDHVGVVELNRRDEEMRQIQEDVKAREREYDVRLKMEEAKHEAAQQQMIEMKRLAEEERLRQEEALQSQIIAAQQDKENQLRRVCRWTVAWVECTDSARAQ